MPSAKNSPTGSPRELEMALLTEDAVMADRPLERMSCVSGGKSRRMHRGMRAAVSRPGRLLVQQL